MLTIARDSSNGNGFASKRTWNGFEKGGVSMANEITYKKKSVPRAKLGGKMTAGAAWRLFTTKGQRRYFPGTLITTFNFGKTRLAVFSVPKK
jgi:hypothetical protein